MKTKNELDLRRIVSQKWLEQFVEIWYKVRITKFVIQTLSNFCVYTE